jgi:WD40 repeat protein
MSRVACVFAVFGLLSFAQVATADDLPPGALVRLGDDSYRTGGAIEHFAISPDGKQFATTIRINKGVLALTVWDVGTGQPIREQKVNRLLFKGLAWGAEGAFAVILRAELATKDKRAKVFPDDFRVWDFTNPQATPPLLPQETVGLNSPSLMVDAEWPENSPEYSDFVFSADGHRVAARYSGDGGSIRVFDLKHTDSAAKLKRVGVINLGAEGADSFHISADGKALVTFRKLANPDVFEAAATVWDIASGKPAKPVRVPFALSMIITPDARSLVVEAGDDDGKWGFDLIDIATAKRRKLIRWELEILDADEPPNSIGKFAFSPSGQELIVAIGFKSVVIDLKGGKELGRIEGHAIHPDFIAVSGDGTRIATADSWGLVRLWGAKTFRPLHEAAGHRTPIAYAQLSPDGKRVLTWGYDKTVRLWDLATGKELRAFFGTRAEDDKPTFTPDGTAILYSTTKQLISRDLQTGLEVPLPGGLAKLEPHYAVFSPDGKSVLTWTDRGWCSVWDWPSGKKRFDIREGPGADSPGFSSDGSVIFSNVLQPDRWDATTGKKLPPAWDVEREEPLTTLTPLRPNPRWLLVNAKDAPRLIEAGTGKRLSQFELSYTKDHHPKVRGYGLAVAPTGGQFAYETFIKRITVIVCEIASGDSRRVLQGHRGEARVLGFTPDGTRLLTAGDDHTIVVWDMRLQNVPLPETLKKETDAAKLWNALATGNAKDAYLAMSRLARDPDAAIKMSKMKLKPATKNARDTDATKLADARAIELLESLDTDASRELLKELADGYADAFRTQEAKRAQERTSRLRNNR